ncbi:hypothetical protein JOM56_009474 [Amanita muscaria]
MAVKAYTWITLWFLITAPVVLWDAGYCFMRPRSMRGGDLHWLWKPYSIYQDIDLASIPFVLMTFLLTRMRIVQVYGLSTLQAGDGFTNAQSLLNVIETALNLTYVYLAHVAGWHGAPLIGFASAVMTLSKTVLYMAQDYYCNWCSVGHNPLDKLIVYFVIPNGMWIIFPSLIIKRLGQDIASMLVKASASTISSKKKN